MREHSDEAYVIDLCDKVLNRAAKRGHRFEFLIGDKGHKLPVDAFYEDLMIVVEYRERQHSEAVTHFDKRQTVSGMSRGQQRVRYDQRRREVLPKHEIRLVEIDYSQFSHTSSKRLKRVPPEDIKVLQKLLRDNAA